MHPISKTIGNYEELIDLILKNLEDVKIDIGGRQIDHIAFRASSADQFEEVKQRVLKEHGSLLNEKMIRERRVCILKLHEPIKYKGFNIPYLEILEPAEGDRQFKRQLEHAEVVLDDTSLSLFASRYPDVNFETKNLNKEINPELILIFSNDANVKFHPTSISEVIKAEKIV